MLLGAYSGFSVVCLNTNAERVISNFARGTDFAKSRGSVSRVRVALDGSSPGSRVLESNNGFANNMTSGSIVGFFGAVGKVIPVRYAGAEIIAAPERFADFGQMTWTGFSRWNASTIALASAGALIKAQ